MGSLVEMSVRQGIDSLRDGDGPLVPFVLAEVDGERTLVRFVDETLEGGAEQAVSYATKVSEDARARQSAAYAVAVFDGYATVDGRRQDAVVLRAVDAAGKVHSFVQRYRPKTFARPFAEVGNLIYVDSQPR